MQGAGNTLIFQFRQSAMKRFSWKWPPPLPFQKLKNSAASAGGCFPENKKVWLTAPAGQRGRAGRIWGGCGCGRAGRGKLKARGLTRSTKMLACCNEQGRGQTSHKFWIQGNLSFATCGLVQLSRFWRGAEGPGMDPTLTRLELLAITHYSYLLLWWQCTRLDV